MQLLATGGDSGGGNYQRNQGVSGGQQQGSGGNRDGSRAGDSGSSVSPPTATDDGFTDDEIPF